MGNEKGFLKVLSICSWGIMLAPISVMPANADVDIWNEDGAAYRVVVLENSQQSELALSAGKFRKSICYNCVVTISPLSGDHWSDQIEASGMDVITIEHGSLRIGEGSRE